MGIKSTYRIKREDAIDRIERVVEIIKKSDFKELELRCNEDDCDIGDFILTFHDGRENLDKFNTLDKWTNKMIEEQIDLPFFRRSMFENYFIED